LDTGGAPGVDAEATPACMAACEKKALVVGDLNDPQSDVSRLIADNLVRGIREDLGVKPKVYYIGL
jgi:phenylacetyl-CoA:acceptor oxidoreductase subunit 1